MRFFEFKGLMPVFHIDNQCWVDVRPPRPLNAGASGALQLQALDQAQQLTFQAPAVLQEDGSFISLNPSLK
jgi:hypothetical protein